MKEQSTQLCLLLLNIEYEEYTGMLYDLYEAYADKYSLIKDYYSYSAFRKWWMMEAERFNQLFDDSLFLNGQCEYELHTRDQDGEDHFYEGQSAIRRQYMRYMKLMMLSLPMNVSVLDICVNQSRQSNK